FVFQKGSILKKIILMTCLMLGGAASAAVSDTSFQKNTITTSEIQVPLKDIRRFTIVIAQIKNNYVEPIDDKKLFDNAIRGLLSHLDPYSQYWDSRELKNLSVETSGEVADIGVELTSDERGDIRVIAPLDESPAQKVGIKPGDIFLKIDDRIVSN